MIRISADALEIKLKELYKAEYDKDQENFNNNYYALAMLDDDEQYRILIESICKEILKRQESSLQPSLRESLNIDRKNIYFKVINNVDSEEDNPDITFKILSSKGIIEENIKIATCEIYIETLKHILYDNCPLADLYPTPSELVPISCIQRLICAAVGADKYSQVFIEIYIV